MVTLREWWTERWQGLAEWQQALLVTLVGGGAVTRGLPFVERLSRSLSTFSQIISVGIFAIGGLFLWNRKRIGEFETQMDERLDRLVELQNKSLLRLDDLLAAVSETEAVTDGGESRREVHRSVPAAMRASSAPSPSTWSLLVVAILGSLVGFLLALGTGLGEPGSVPVTAVSLVMGGIAVGIVEYGWHSRPRSENTSRRAIRESGSMKLRYDPDARPDRIDDEDRDGFGTIPTEIVIDDIERPGDDEAVVERRLDDEELRLTLADLRRRFEDYQNHPDRLEAERREDGVVIRPKREPNRD